ncbi:GPO family capsid scaffolding protein [Methylomonas sp. EFPC1]|uniref:GPO family capsid scaffolding protein n=1 Tax=Methylomonas sp. EFPC1 TaxID=2812647 RepID=UPI0019671FC7|nr:GPO family capsid scaffolding protein [Methylomonas sp. EFPC1]QSB01982.1 GPO family capsid scaffolding protein [Methylomonas sp. EFPC1]
MTGRVLTTDYKRIGVSGPTSDGRVIDPVWIDEMAETYDPEKTFKALIWPDHMRYMNYGSVESLKATTGVDGRRELWAVLSPNTSYQLDNKYDRRLFTSMEITFDFAKSGKAYLTGLGATDEPASLGTSEIKFNKHAQAAGMILSGFIESETKTFTDQAPASLLDQIKALFTNQKPEDADMADKAALEKLSTDVAALAAKFAKLETADKQPDPKPDDLAAQFAALQKSHEELQAKFNALQAAGNQSAEKTELDELKAEFAKLQTTLNDALKEQPGTEGGEHFGANGDANSQYI